MKLITQNLFLFFEENDDEKDISSSLVHLYMNRFVIAEEDQTEIIGVYNLSKSDDYNAKLEHDESLFEKLGSEIESFGLNSQTSVNHFLIGSSTSSTTSISIVENWIDKFLRNYHNEVKRREIALEITNWTDWTELDRLERRLNNIDIEYLITILMGSQSNLLTTAQVKLAHAGSKNESELINNDLKEYHQLIRESFVPSSLEDASHATFMLLKKGATVEFLSFYKQLTDAEVEKLKPSLLDRTYEIELNQQNWKTQKSRDALLSLLAKTDPGYQYLQCNCQRHSFTKNSKYKPYDS